jgi:hypothetical protein
MDVMLDGKPIHGDHSAGLTLQDLLGGAFAGGEERMITSARLDGQTLENEALAEILARPLSSPGRLELTTESLAGLAAGVLQEAIEALELTRAHHVPIAEQLAAGLTAEAMELLTQTLSAWNSAEQSLRQVCLQAGLDLEAPLPKPLGRAPAMEVAACRDLLRRIGQALRGRDFVEVGDLVEHELSALTDQWQEMLAAVRQTLRAAQKP